MAGFFFGTLIVLAPHRNMGSANGAPGMPMHAPPDKKADNAAAPAKAPGDEGSR